MGVIEVAIEEDVARTLAIEADHLGFEGLDEYVRWIVGHRHDIAADDEPSRRLDALADRARAAGAEADETALAATVASEDEPTIDGSVERVSRLEDEDLSVAADALSTVEADRVDVFARRAVEQTRARLGASADSGIDYDPSTGLADDDPSVTARSAVADVEVPGRDEDLVERRRTAVGAALAYLRDVEEAQRSDFVAELYDEYPAGYDSANAWWECIKSGLRQVDRVDPAGAGSRTWGYRTTPGRITRISF